MANDAGRYSIVYPRQRPRMKMTPEELEELLKKQDEEKPEEEDPPATVPRPELVKAWVEVMNFYPDRGR